MLHVKMTYNAYINISDGILEHILKIETTKTGCSTTDKDKTVLIMAELQLEQTSPHSPSSNDDGVYSMQACNYGTVSGSRQTVAVCCTELSIINSPLIPF